MRLKATSVPTDNEMEALLRILKSPSDNAEAVADSGGALSPPQEEEAAEAEEAAGGPAG